MMNSAPSPAYPEPIDAIVLAGTDSNPKRLIVGQNKAFLEVGDEVLVQGVVNALRDAPSIHEIFVVGPAERLREMLGESLGDVFIVEQSGSMISNAWAAIKASESRYRKRVGRDDPLRPLLFISSDLPLVSTEAVEDFISRCAREDSRSTVKYAMLTGVAEEASLTPYYPVDGQSGIHRPYVNFSDCRVRLANIYVGRPRGLTNHQFLQTGFAHRKAEKLVNVIILVWKFLSQRGGIRAAWITLRLQLTLMASKKKGRLYRWLRARNRTGETEKACSDVLGGPVRIVVTPYGGLSLDVDNEEDFRILSRNYAAWSRIGSVESGD